MSCTMTQGTALDTFEHIDRGGAPTGRSADLWGNRPETYVRAHALPISGCVSVSASVTLGGQSDSSTLYLSPDKARRLAEEILEACDWLTLNAVEGGR